MANATPEAPPAGYREDYVLCSGVRSGLKREFAFALKARTEMLMSPMSRTRSGRVHHSPASSPEAAAKRRRTSGGADAPSVVSAPPEGSPILPSPAEAALQDVEAVGPVGMEEMAVGTTNAALPAVQVNGSSVESFVPVQIESGRMPSTTPTDACVMADKVLSVQVDARPVVELLQTIQTEAEATADTGPSIQEDTMPAVETLQAVQPKVEATADSVLSLQVDARSAVELPQTSQIEAEAMADTAPTIPAEPGPGVETLQAIRIEAQATADTVPSTQVELRPVMGTPLTSQIAAEAEADAVSSIRLRAGPVVEVAAQSENCIRLKNVENGMPDKPMRRFTRSLLKSAVKEPSPPVGEESPVPMAEDSSAASNGSDGLEEVKDSADTESSPDGPLSMTPKNKMELKMSKKIALTKFPSNIRELLATGLLEGKAVKYTTNSFYKQEGLRGVIKDGGILCFCASCKGLKIISAYHFELHAGSKKKHPSDFIYLDNGNTIHDILRACSSAPLDMLESTIQNAISSEGNKPLNFGKESSTKSAVEKLASACDSGLVAKVSPTSPNLSGESATTVRHPRSIFSPTSSDSTSRSMLSQKNGRGRMTTKDVRLHKLVFKDDILPNGTEVAYYARGQRLLKGYIKGSGIFCHCCKEVISPSLFEAHAGWASRRKPYLNIYTSNGVSLHELSISLSKDKKFPASESDNLCRICADGGDLLLCDLCPRAFHKECIGLTSLPKGDWYCPCCQNMHLKDKSVGHNENAIAAGRVAGVDPIEQIFKRCIRIVKTPEADVGGCVLCRCHDFCTGFGPRTVMLCDQCEREFHVGCLQEHNMGDLKELPEGKWFCSSGCGQIHAALQKLLASGGEQLPILQSDVIKRKHEENGPGKGMDLDVRWRLLSGKTTSPETRLLLSSALSIFYECFDPIVDFATRKDLIPAMVYGMDLDLRDQDFEGMYCAVLTVNSSVVSAAILRVLGCEIAELPLVATSRESQGKGYFQSLFSCIERMLVSLNVRHMVLPAADEAESIWTRKFGFSKVPVDQRPEYMKGYRTMIFEGTSLLHKSIAKSVTD